MIKVVFKRKVIQTFFLKITNHCKYIREDNNMNNEHVHFNIYVPT